MEASARELRAFRSRPADRRQGSHLVTLAHFNEQSRLSLGSYGRPWMTEELKKIGLDVGYRRVGRLVRQNGISVVRARNHKVATDSNHIPIAHVNARNGKHSDKQRWRSLNISTASTIPDDGIQH